MVVVGHVALEVAVYVHIVVELVTVARILEVRHMQSVVVFVAVALVVLVALEVQLEEPLNLGVLVIEDLNLIVTGQDSFVVVVVVVVVDHLVSGKDFVDVVLENLRL
jgi:uncharacterized membrane protein